MHLNMAKTTQKIEGVSEIQSLLSQEWANALRNEFACDYWKGLIGRLNKSHTQWLPMKKDLFNALNNVQREEASP